ncbi:hypothetical protein HY504_01665 [Candidatus Wolfebacteria bacterium]|nr:hypothetical protein [Candidatus Wolfebacteria bacterium]
MAKKMLKVYTAGKINPNSIFGTHDWRDDFCRELEYQSGVKLINLDPAKAKGLNQNDAELVFGRDAFMIQSADLVIVYLSDDISVGGSQEMLIAKYYKRPLVGIAARNGKFKSDKKKIFGKVYKNHTDPFVKTSCDAVVETLDELAKIIKNFPAKGKIKDISLIDKANVYYKKKFYHRDKYLWNQLKRGAI